MAAAKEGLEVMPIKVLYIYYEPFVSGQTTHVLSLVRNLDRSQFKPFVILPQSLRELTDLYEAAGVEVYLLKFGKIRWSWNAVQKLASLISSEKINIVHVHSQEAGLIARPICWLAGARCIVYTPQTIDIRKRLFFFLYQLVEFIMSSLTTAIISVNEPDRMRLSRWGIPASKIKTIANGIDPDRFIPSLDQNAAKRQLNLDESRPLVLQVGRLSPQKNPLAFINGAKQVLEKFPQAQFVLVGDGPLHNDVDAYISKLGLAGAIKRVGWQEPLDLWLQAADVVTLTSSWEGSPYSILEAMSCAAPVVVYGVNGCVEIVRDCETGFVVPVGNIQVWSARVTQLLAETDLAAWMGKQGRRWVQERYSISTMVRQIELLYLSLL